VQLTSQIQGLLSVVADINCKSEAGPTSIAKSHSSLKAKPQGEG